MKSILYLFLTLMSLLLVSCEEILLEEDISNSELEILAPKQNAVINASAVSFHWTEVEGATAYQIQIATPNFEQPRQILADTEVEDVFFTKDLLKNSYEWRVKALNSGYQTPFVAASFTVKSNEGFSSNQVVLLFPENSHITNEEILSLEWSEVEDAILYRVQVLENGNPIKEETTTNFHMDIEFPNGEFTWRVRAENETQNTFYTERSIVIDTVAPNIPELARPEDAASLSTESVTFEWDRTAINGSAEMDSLFIFKDVGLEELVEKARVTISHNTILERQETYYWLMKSFDEAGNKSEASEVFSFTVN